MRPEPIGTGAEEGTSPLEVDVLSVGEGGRGGDAVAIRLGDRDDREPRRVIVVDGGDTETGTRLVEFIAGFYGTDRVDLLVATHLETGHLAGLQVVVDELEVGGIWMRRPWAGPASRRRRGVRPPAAALDLEDAALQAAVPVVEPIAGLEALGGAVRVLAALPEGGSGSAARGEGLVLGVGRGGSRVMVAGGPGTGAPPGSGGRSWAWRTPPAAGDGLPLPLLGAPAAAQGASARHGARVLVARGRVHREIHGRLRDGARPVTARRLLVG